MMKARDPSSSNRNSARCRPFSLRSGASQKKGAMTMNVRQLFMHGALAALTAAGAVAIVSPADARLACNQYGTCWWTGDTPDYARANSDYYAHKWGVRIVNGDRDRDYDRDYY